MVSEANNEVDEIEALSHRDYSGGVDQVNAKALYFRRFNGIAYEVPLGVLTKFDLSKDKAGFDQYKAKTFGR